MALSTDELKSSREQSIKNDTLSSRPKEEGRVSWYRAKNIYLESIRVASAPKLTKPIAKEIIIKAVDW